LPLAPDFAADAITTSDAFHAEERCWSKVFWFDRRALRRDLVPENSAATL
jgi:hypothetical protein